MPTTEAPFVTIGDVARRFGLPTWRIRRIYETGILPPPPRVGLYRLIAAADVPIIEDILRRAGHLPKKAEAVAC